MTEAGTLFLKREGMCGLKGIQARWKGLIVADLKTMDGALWEVEMVHAAGATAVTVLGSAPPETLNLFVQHCQQRGLISMIDMLGISDPLHVLRHLLSPPDVVVLHRGRDEESTRGKVIQYRHVKRITSKYDVIISAAGGVDLREAPNAIFNGAGIVVVTIVHPNTPWQGIRVDGDVGQVAQQFLQTIK